MAKATTSTRLCLAAALVLAAPLLAGTALAQIQTAPSVTVTLDASILSLGAGNATVVNGTVANGGSLQGTVALALTLPEGWSATLDPPSSFTLAAGQSAPITLTLVAPPAGEGAATGDLFLDATLTEANTGRPATSQAALTLTRVDPVIPPPPPPYGLYAALAAGATGLAGGGLVYARARSRRLARERAAAEEARRKAEHEAYLARETGVGISLVDGPHRYGARRELVYRVAIENQTARERAALIGVASCPEGWTAAPALPKATLKPHERIVVAFCVSPGDAVPGGAVGHLAFYAKPEEARELDQRVTLDVHAPEARVPERGEVPVVTPREPVPPRPVLRK